MSNTIKGKVVSPLAIDKTLTKEYMCADAKATGDAIKELNEDVTKKINDNKASADAIETVGLWVEPKITSTKGVCYKNGKVCTFVFDFTTNQVIDKGGIPLYADLPMPKDNIVFVAHTMDGVPYWLGVYPTETSSKGILSTSYVNDIPSGTRLFGTVTYITAE